MPDADAVHATIDAYLAAFNASDRERWLGLFADDA
jgi:ketosteroid isomerase-like protein